MSLMGLLGTSFQGLGVVLVGHPCEEVSNSVLVEEIIKVFLLETNNLVSPSLVLNGFVWSFEFEHLLGVVLEDLIVEPVVIGGFKVGVWILFAEVLTNGEDKFAVVACQVFVIMLQRLKLVLESFEMAVSSNPRVCSKRMDAAKSYLSGVDSYPRNLFNLQEVIGFSGMVVEDKDSKNQTLERLFFFSTNDKIRNSGSVILAVILSQMRKIGVACWPVQNLSEISAEAGVSANSSAPISSGCVFYLSEMPQIEIALDGGKVLIIEGNRMMFSINHETFADLASRGAWKTIDYSLILMRLREPGEVDCVHSSKINILQIIRRVDCWVSEIVSEQYRGNDSTGFTETFGFAYELIFFLECIESSIIIEVFVRYASLTRVGNPSQVVAAVCSQHFLAFLMKRLPGYWVFALCYQKPFCLEFVLLFGRNSVLSIPSWEVNSLAWNLIIYACKGKDDVMVSHSEVADLRKLIFEKGNDKVVPEIKFLLCFEPVVSYVKESQVVAVSFCWGFVVEDKEKIPDCIYPNSTENFRFSLDFARSAFTECDSYMELLDSGCNRSGKGCLCFNFIFSASEFRADSLVESRVGGLQLEIVRLQSFGPKLLCQKLRFDIMWGFIAMKSSEAGLWYGGKK